MSSLPRSWPWRVDDFTLEAGPARQPAMCLDPGGRAHLVWLRAGDAAKSGQRLTEMRTAVVSGNDAVAHTSAVCRDPLLHPRAVWTNRGLETFALTRYAGRWIIGQPRRAERWYPAFATDMDVLGFDVAPGPQGEPAFVYQARQGRQFQVYVRLGYNRPSMEVGTGDSSRWRPCILAAPGGRFWVMWEAFASGQFRVVCRPIFPDGGMGPVMAVPAEDQFALDAAGDVDRLGHLWIVCRRTDPWGRDSHFLNPDATIILSCVGTDRVLSTFRVPIPPDPKGVKLPATPTVVCHEAGGVSVFFRWFRDAIPNDWGWDLNQIALQDGEWSDIVKVTADVGHCDERAVAAERDGVLRIAYEKCSYDGYRDPPHDRAIRLKRLRLDEVHSRLRPHTEQAATLMVLSGARFHAVAPLGESRAAAVVLGKTELTPLWGDLHRHTNLSKCLSENDGTLQDHYRWAIEAAGLDFYAVADHYSYIDGEDWAEILRMAELYNAPGVFTTFPAYEWHHEGHANFYFADAQAAEQVWAQIAGERSLGRIYAALDEAGLRRRVMVIRHYHGDAMLGSAQRYWQSVNRDYESAVEVAQTRGFSPQSYEWLLSHGRRLGAVGASDHSRRPEPGVHAPMVYAAAITGLFSESLSRSAVFDAIRRRRTFATNGKRMALWFSVDDIFMGGEGIVSASPKLTIHADATTTLESVEVIRDGEVLVERAASEESVDLVLDDPNLAPGEHYYYVKVRQAPDRVHEYPGMAWSSPVWVSVHG